MSGLIVGRGLRYHVDSSRFPSGTTPGINASHSLLCQSLDGAERGLSRCTYQSGHCYTAPSGHSASSKTGETNGPGLDQIRLIQRFGAFDPFQGNPLARQTRLCSEFGAMIVLIEILWKTRILSRKIQNAFAGNRRPVSLSRLSFRGGADSEGVGVVVERCRGFPQFF